MSLHVAILSMHSSPLARLGRKNHGGMSVYVRELAWAIAKRGHRVDIFTGQATGAEVQRTELFPNVNLYYVPGGYSGTEPETGSLYDHLSDYVESIDDFRQDSNATYSLIHSNYWLSGLIGEQLKMRWQCPHVVTFHTLGSAKTRTGGSPGEHKQRISAEEKLIAACDGVMAPTEAERELYIKFHQAAAESVHIVPCAVDLELFQPRYQRHPRKHKSGSLRSSQLLVVGRFDPMKGLDTLFHSLALLPHGAKIQLQLVGGDGPESQGYQRLAQLAQELGVERQVEFKGAVRHELMPQYYHGADAVVVPSRYESFGLVILEALACGVPVAAMPVGIAPEIIKPGINGYLAERADIESLGQAISKTVSLARRADKRKIRASVAHLTWDRAAAMLLEVYGKVIHNVPAAARGKTL